MDKNAKKLRVLHVLKSSIYSGAENVVITIIKALQDEFDMIYVAADGEIRKHLEQEQIPMELLPKFDRKGLRAAVQKYQPDIVHAHDFSATVMCASIRSAVSKHTFCLISHLHYDPPWVTRWNAKTIAYSLCKKRISRVITVTNRAYETMVFANAFRDKHIGLSNPIDKSRILRLASQPMDGNINGSGSGSIDGLAGGNLEMRDNCELIFVGRFVEQKNPQRFIYLVDNLRKRGFDDIRAWMLGDGELWEECDKIVHELGLERQIELKGFQSNPYYYMKQAKLLCITSGWEGYGLVAAEANILGVPVLSTRNSGCTEVLGEDSQELCSGDEEFIEKIEKLLKDYDEMEQWRQKSLERAEQFMTIDNYQAKLKNIYISEVE